MVKRVMIIKRYLVFTGDKYYPSGGMEDFFESFSTIEQAKDALENNIKETRKQNDGFGEYWGHIYDLDINKIVYAY